MVGGTLVARDKKTGSDDAPKGGKKKKIPQANAKLAADLVHKLGVISQWRRKSISAILDPQIRQFVEAEFQLAVQEMNEATQGTTPQPPSPGS